MRFGWAVMMLRGRLGVRGTVTSNRVGNRYGGVLVTGLPFGCVPAGC